MLHPLAWAMLRIRLRAQLGLAGRPTCDNLAQLLKMVMSIHTVVLAGGRRGLARDARRAAPRLRLGPRITAGPIQRTSASPKRSRSDLIDGVPGKYTRQASGAPLERPLCERYWGTPVRYRYRCVKLACDGSRIFHWRACR